MMHGRRKSDSAIVAVKPANNAERSAAEPVEPRAGTKGNAGQQSTRRTQSRISVSKMLARIRQIVAVDTRGRSRMRESCMYGSVRGARGDSRPYRDQYNRLGFVTPVSAPRLLAPLASGTTQNDPTALGGHTRSVDRPKPLNDALGSKGERSCTTIRQAPGGWQCLASASPKISQLVRMCSIQSIFAIGRSRHVARRTANMM